jgi:hypothetical protein
VVTIPNVPLSKIIQNEALVTLPGDSPTVSETQATVVADQWAEHYAGTTVYNSITLAHVQTLKTDGSPDGSPGTLQWIFAITGPNSFSKGFGGVPAPIPGQATTATPSAYPYPAHYVIIGIDATSGLEDGMTLT